ncbi:hypothetical protein PUN28_000770 [Cardiocondyla obscurior]|uniref:Uncharacterized protein n=1 Tax=Cardiocondyla obscurior TaxID=286306 RepID=A0AAW2H0Y7_9HYME
MPWRVSARGIVIYIHTCMHVYTYTYTCTLICTTVIH